MHNDLKKKKKSNQVFFTIFPFYGSYDLFSLLCAYNLKVDITVGILILTKNSASTYHLYVNKFMCKTYLGHVTAKGMF